MVCANINGSSGCRRRVVLTVMSGYVDSKASTPPSAPDKPSTAALLPDIALTALSCRKCSQSQMSLPTKILSRKAPRYLLRFYLPISSDRRNVRTLQICKGSGLLTLQLLSTLSLADLDIALLNIVVCAANRKTTLSSYTLLSSSNTRNLVD